MAVTTTPLGAPTSYGLSKDSALTNAFTASKNIRNGSTTFYGSVCTYPTATAAASFLKLYDNAGVSLVAGTTEPDFIVKMDTTETAFGANGLFCHEGALFSNGLSYLMTTLGGKSASAAPSQTVQGTFLTT